MAGRGANAVDAAPFVPKPAPLEFKRSLASTVTATEFIPAAQRSFPPATAAAASVSKKVHTEQVPALDEQPVFKAPSKSRSPSRSPSSSASSITAVAAAGAAALSVRRPGENKAGSLLSFYSAGPIKAAEYEEGWTKKGGAITFVDVAAFSRTDALPLSLHDAVYHAAKRVAKLKTDMKALRRGVWRWALTRDVAFDAVIGKYLELPNHAEFIQRAAENHAAKGAQAGAFPLPEWLVKEADALLQDTRVAMATAIGFLRKAGCSEDGWRLGEAVKLTFRAAQVLNACLPQGRTLDGAELSAAAGSDAWVSDLQAGGAGIRYWTYVPVQRGSRGRGGSGKLP